MKSPQFECHDLVAIILKDPVICSEPPVLLASESNVIVTLNDQLLLISHKKQRSIQAKTNAVALSSLF
jgi:hypothetical protein